MRTFQLCNHSKCTLIHDDNINSALEKFYEIFDVDAQSGYEIVTTFQGEYSKTINVIELNLQQIRSESI